MDKLISFIIKGLLALFIESLFSNNNSSNTVRNSSKRYNNHLWNESLKNNIKIGDNCPICGGKLSTGTTKNGCRYIKCENNSWSKSARGWDKNSCICFVRNYSYQKPSYPVYVNTPIKETTVTVTEVSSNHGIVYMYKNTSNGKVYIGMTRNELARQKSHIKSFEKRESKKFYNMIRSEGIKSLCELEYKVLYRGVDYISQERKYINIHNSVRSGYNAR